MGKIIGAALIGVVIGAAVAEVMKRQKPDLCKDLGHGLKKRWDAVKDAFKEGYAQASAPAESAAESA